MKDHRSYIHNLSRCEIRSTSTAILRTHNVICSQLADSSVGRALHWYGRGHEFEARSSPPFFQALISQLLNVYLRIKRCS